LLWGLCCAVLCSWCLCCAVLCCAVLCCARGACAVLLLVPVLCRFAVGAQSMDGIKALSDAIPEDEVKRLEKQVGGLPHSLG